MRPSSGAIDGLPIQLSQHSAVTNGEARIAEAPGSAAAVRRRARRARGAGGTRARCPRARRMHLYYALKANDVHVSTSKVHELRQPDDHNDKSQRKGDLTKIINANCH